MLSKRKEFYVPGSITELKVNKIENGQVLFIRDPWGTATFLVDRPIRLNRKRSERSRGLNYRPAEKVWSQQFSQDFPLDVDPLGSVQPAVEYKGGKKKVLQAKEMFGALYSAISDSLRACASGAHYGLNIKGLGWRAIVRTGEEVPGGEAVPMQVEKPGQKRIVPYISPGLLVDAEERFLELKIGNSHYAHYHLKGSRTAYTADYKGQWMLVSGGTSTASVGQFASKIRATRPVEPYKGKGIRFQGHGVRRKEGKVAAL